MEIDVAFMLKEVGFTLKFGDFDFSISDWFEKNLDVFFPGLFFFFSYIHIRFCDISKYYRYRESLVSPMFHDILKKETMGEVICGAAAGILLFDRSINNATFKGVIY